jgi:hypothetical protein
VESDLVNKKALGKRRGLFVCDEIGRLAPGPGFEPGLEASKAPVLPLNDPGTQLPRISDICAFCGSCWRGFLVSRGRHRMTW